MRLPVVNELAALVEDTMAPCLEKHGFSRRGSDFLRPVEDQLVQVISVQSSQYDSATYARWTLNIAVHAPELREIRGFPPADETPDASGCWMSIRVADLLPREGMIQELWYQLGSDGIREALELPPDTVRQIVKSDLERAVIPHLETIRNREALYRFSRSGKCPSAGPLDWIALELALGKHDEARTSWRTNLPDRMDVKRYARARFGVDF